MFNVKVVLRQTNVDYFSYLFWFENLLLHFLRPYTVYLLLPKRTTVFNVHFTLLCSYDYCTDPKFRCWNMFRLIGFLWYPAG